jgi:hypothetical protein
VTATVLAARLEALLDEPDRRERMRLAQLAYARRSGFDGVAERLLEIVAALAPGPGVPALPRG